MTSSDSDGVHPERHGRTIIVSESDAECAARLLRLIAGEIDSAEPQAHTAAAVETADPSQQLRLARARKIIRNRQLRADYFNRAMFGEAAWDILLLLYVTEVAGSRQTQASLSKMLTTPPTTVQRWVDYLEKEHLIRRDPHPTDRRTAFVSLLAKGRSSLDDYLAVVGE